MQLKNSPGRHSYTSLAAVHWRFSFSIIQVSKVVHLSNSYIEFALSWHSIIPLAMGWYAVIRVCFNPSDCISFVQSVNLNWHPQSVMTVDGTPNMVIQSWTLTTFAVMSCIGVALWSRKWAYVYLVKSSIRRYECGEWGNHVLLNVGSFPPPDIPIDIGPYLW